MPCTYYIANGFCRAAEAVGEPHGMSEVRFFNPMAWETRVRMTVYYADAPPREIPEFTIPGEGNPLLVFPQHHTEFFQDCGPWGMRLVSDTVLMIDHIGVCGRKAPEGNVRFSGGVVDSLASSRLSRLWYFGDGLKLTWDPENAPWPFNEFEWYHVLNPTNRDAHVRMKCYYGDGTRETHEYTVLAERVMLIDNIDLVKTNNPFGIRFVSDSDLLVESTRYICGLHSMEEWGATVHCYRPGLPAPLEWNEEDVVA
jgi:hypothetical protein